MTPLDLVGWAASASTIIISMPQLVTALRHSPDELRGVSRTTWAITIANATVWLAWAAVAGQPAVAAPSFVNLPAALIILYRTRG